MAMAQVTHRRIDAVHNRKQSINHLEEACLQLSTDDWRGHRDPVNATLMGER